MRRRPSRVAQPGRIFSHPPGSRVPLWRGLYPFMSGAPFGGLDTKSGWHPLSRTLLRKTGGAKLNKTMVKARCVVFPVRHSQPLLQISGLKRQQSSCGLARDGKALRPPSRRQKESSSTPSNSQVVTEIEPQSQTRYHLDGPPNYSPPPPPLFSGWPGC